jgi:hypothetical protein
MMAILTFVATYVVDPPYHTAGGSTAYVATKVSMAIMPQVDLQHMWQQK